MKFINLNGGVVSGEDCLVLFKSKNFIEVESCNRVIFRDLHGSGASQGRLKQTLDAIKFIWEIPSKKVN